MSCRKVPVFANRLETKPDRGIDATVISQATTATATNGPKPPTVEFEIPEEGRTAAGRVSQVSRGFNTF